MITLTNLLNLRGMDAIMFAAFCLAGVGLYYSIKNAIYQGGR